MHTHLNVELYILQVFQDFKNIFMHNNSHEHYKNHFTVAGLMKMGHLSKYVPYIHIERYKTFNILQ